MNITISLPERTEADLRDRAAERGVAVDEFVRDLIERQLTAATRFEQLTKPIADAVRAAGLSGEDAESFFENAVREVRAERRVNP